MQPKSAADGSPVDVVVGSIAGRRWIGSVTHQLRCDRQQKTSSGTAQSTSSNSDTGVVLKVILTCFCSFSLFVRKPLGSHQAFCWPPYQEVNTSGVT